MDRTNWIEKELGDILTLNYGWSLPEPPRIIIPSPRSLKTGTLSFNSDLLDLNKGVGDYVIVMNSCILKSPTTASSGKVLCGHILEIMKSRRKN
jgi:hypothetical protein